MVKKKFPENTSLQFFEKQTEKSTYVLIIKLVIFNNELTDNDVE